jgi:hypothetical protein
LAAKNILAMNPSIMSIQSYVLEPESVSRPPEHVSSQNWKLQIAVLAAIALIGALSLPQPFYDDQALFAIGAQRISHGQLLYRDYWDIKQPGIFIFYLLAGKLFGFSEIGIHAFELLYLITLSLILSWTLRWYYRATLVADLVPFLTVGVYYGVAGIVQLGQVEGLVSVPMFLCLWFAYSATGELRFRFARLLLSGFLGGIVLLFKLMFAPIILAFWITTLVFLLKREAGQNLRSMSRNCLVIGAGILIPMAIMFGYFAHFGILRMVRYTFFVYPPEAVRQLAHPGPGRLLDSLQWFLTHFAPLLVLGLIGAWGALSRAWDLLTLNLLLWVGLGGFVILLQTTSWWRYHFMLFVVPLGLLAAKGIEIVWAALSDSGRATMWTRHHYCLPVLSLIFLFAPMLNSIMAKGCVLARYHFAITKEDRFRYQSDRFLYPDSLYPSVIQETKFLSDRGSLPGAIYVIGNPLFYYLSGRPQAIAPTGGFELFLTEQWKWVATELRQATPPYIFVSDSDRDLFEHQASNVRRFVEANYHVLRTDSGGTWYVLTPPSVAQHRDSR